MKIERKKLTIKKEKLIDVVSTSKKIKKSTRFEGLEDAIIDGHLNPGAGPGAELIAQRFRNGKNVLSALKVISITEQGILSTWDETLEQFFIICLSEKNGLIKIVKKCDVSQEMKQ